MRFLAQGLGQQFDHGRSLGRADRVVWVGQRGDIRGHFETLQGGEKGLRLSACLGELSFQTDELCRCSVQPGGDAAVFPFESLGLLSSPGEGGLQLRDLGFDRTAFPAQAFFGLARLLFGLRQRVEIALLLRLRRRRQQG